MNEIWNVCFQEDIYIYTVSSKILTNIELHYGRLNLNNAHEKECYFTMSMKRTKDRMHNLKSSKMSKKC